MTSTARLSLTVKLALLATSVVLKPSMAELSALKVTIAPEDQALDLILAQLVPMVTHSLARKTSTSVFLAHLATTALKLPRHLPHHLQANTRLCPVCQVKQLSTSAHPSITVLTQV